MNQQIATHFGHKAALAALVLAVSARAEDRATWSVPTRVFPASSEVAKPAQPQMPRPPAKPATSSSPLPPAYQANLAARSDTRPPPNDAAERFIVPLVERPLLVQANITIDGKPFRMLREMRIENLLKELQQPPPSTPKAENDKSQTAEQPAQQADQSVVARLRRHAEATQRPPSHDEVRWLLSHWVAGPTLLYLDENFQRVRANASPLFTVLDRDDDEVISSAEIDQAEQSLLKYDSNQDEVLSLAEINKGAERTSQSTDSLPAMPPLIPVKQLASASVFRRLSESYNDPLPRIDRDADGQVSEAELMELGKATADLAITVDFNTQITDRSKLAVTAADPALITQEPIIREASLTLLIGRAWLELTAVQSSGVTADQISVGAVRDGYPLLPEIDADEDGRLTIRELRQIAKRLKTFDRDGDGAIAKSELLPTVRLSFGHGPVVHRQLATVRSVHPRSATPNVTPPEWFVRMDRNNDLDLTPREFLGGREQFAALDVDGDGLISALEAGKRQN
jgi:Ca2+-binding EF-hand superfamily protein